MDIEAEVFDIVAAITKRPRAEIGAGFALSEENGVDSIGFVEIVMRIETDLEIALSDEAAAAARTAGELVELCRVVRARKA